MLRKQSTDCLSYCWYQQDSYLTPLPRTSRSGNSKTFIRPHSNCNQYAYSFFPWSVNQWNRLPGDIVNIDDNLIARPSYRNWEVVLKNFSHHIYIYYKCLFIIYLLFCCIYIDVMRWYALSINKVEVGSRTHINERWGLDNCTLFRFKYSHLFWISNHSLAL